MNTPLSKAFWLGRNINIIGFVKAVGNADSQEAAVLMRAASNFARSLNVQLPEIPPLDSGEAFKQLKETVVMDLAIVQSELVANCFKFGFDFTSWANFRGGYAFGDTAADVSQSGIDHEKIEAVLREETRLIGLSPKHLEACIEAAKNPVTPNEQFKEWIAMEVVLAITKELDSIAPNAILVNDSEASKRVFIVMSMGRDNPSLEDVLEAIHQVTASLELVAYRVDELDTSGRITDSIVEALRKAAFVVVDLTGSRPNVYWEAGFAHGLGKTPIYIAHEGTDLEFDVKDYPVIYYASMKMLREKLSSRLKKLLESQ